MGYKNLEIEPDQRVSCHLSVSGFLFIYTLWHIYVEGGLGNLGASLNACGKLLKNEHLSVRNNAGWLFLPLVS